MRKTKKITATLAIVAMMLTMIPMQAFAGTSTTDRLAGADRIQTAIQVAEAGWPDGADTAILAPAANENLVDALAAAPLAGQEDAPILLTNNKDLSDATKQELVDLGVSKVYLVGAIDKAVADEVDAMDGVSVEVLKGADRWGTADAINAKLVNPEGSFVVGYNAVPDALSVASYAAAHNYAIVLTKADGTVDSSKLVGSKTYLVGGEGVVKDYAGATRLGGTDRFATNKAVVEGLNFEYSKVYVANGLSLVDALVAAPLAAKDNAPILLASNSDVAAKSAVNPKLSPSSQVIALGGDKVVSDTVKDKVGYAVPAASGTSIQGFVTTPELDEDGAPTGDILNVDGATVSVNGVKVGTDKYGYYNAPSGSGLATVEVSKPGYFNSLAKVPVSKNFSTAENFELTAVDVDKLAVTGTIVDTKTGDPVLDAAVQFQQLKDGKWVDVDNAEATTDANGAFGFYNKEALDDVAVDASNVKFTNTLGNTNVLNVDTKYRLAVSKDYSDTIDGAYEAKSIEFTTSKYQAESTVGLELRPITKLSELKVKLTWDAQADTTNPATIELLDKDGESVLYTYTDIAIPADGDTNNVYDSTVELIADEPQDLTLPTGTYYLRVSGDNGTFIIPVSVTEGGKVSVTGTVKKAESLTVTGSFSSFDKVAATDESGNVPAQFKVYQTINGVDVLITETLPTTDVGAIMFEADNLDPNQVTTFSAANSFTNLAAQSYKVVIESDYILGGEASSTTTVRANAVNNKNMAFDPAGLVSTEVQLRNVDNTANYDIPEGTLIEVKAEVINEDGKVVATETIESFDPYGATDDQNNPAAIEIGGVAPGKYTVRISAGDFKTEVTKEFTVIEFKNGITTPANVTDPATVNLKVNPGVSVKGYVRFADLSPVANTVDGYNASVSVYDKAGEEVDSANIANGAYSFADLDAGTYTFVVRGPGQFETVTKSVSINAGENTVSFTVVQGGEGLVKLTLIDEKGSKVTDADVAVTLEDAYGYSFDLADQGNGIWLSDADIPAGVYTVAVTDQNGKYKDTEFKVTVDKNGTTYKLAEVSLANSDVTFEVSGYITVDAETTGKIVALDANGNIQVIEDWETGALGLTPGDLALVPYSIDVPNGTWTIGIIIDGKFVESHSVVVENLDVTNVNFHPANATR